MRYILLPLLLLSGCAGYAGKAYNEAKAKSDVEKQAWVRVSERTPKECPGGKNTPEDVPASKVIAFSKCSTKLINEEVMPVAAFPELITKMRVAALRNAEAFANGKISRTEWTARGMEAWANYTAEWDSRARGYVNEAAKQDQVLAVQRQQYFQNLSTQIQKQEAAQAAAFPPMRQTTCSKVGNTVNCLTN